jgi:hypothetical protein
MHYYDDLPSSYRHRLEEKDIENIISTLQNSLKYEEQLERTCLCWKQAKVERKAILGKMTCTREATTGRKSSTHTCMEDLMTSGLSFL